MMSEGKQMPMMQMMMDMMNMQEKIIKGANAAEKKKMTKDLTQMKEKMQEMMSMQKGMMGGMMGQPTDVLQSKLTCAEEWLKKAIDLHEIHIKDPKTATETSQMDMMDQMKKACDCITGTGSEISGTPLKESGSKKTEKGKTLKVINTDINNELHLI